MMGAVGTSSRSTSSCFGPRRKRPHDSARPISANYFASSTRVLVVGPSPTVRRIASSSLAPSQCTCLPKWVTKVPAGMGTVLAGSKLLPVPTHQVRGQEPFLCRILHSKGETYPLLFALGISRFFLRGAKNSPLSGVIWQQFTLGWMFLSSNWLEDTPEGDHFVGSYGRVFDVIVLGRPGRDPKGSRMTTLEAALFESGRPVLIAPPSLRAPDGHECLDCMELQHRASAHHSFRDAHNNVA